MCIYESCQSSCIEVSSIATDGSSTKDNLEQAEELLYIDAY
jgi:hypothetical protein